MAMRRRHAEEALALSRELGDTYLIGASLTCLAQVTEATGDLDVVERLHKECLTLNRKSGDRESAANSLLNLAMLSMRRGSPQGTQEKMLEALAIAQDTGSKRMQGSVLGVSIGRLFVRLVSCGAPPRGVRGAYGRDGHCVSA
ncbi:MAG: hypothetical protein E6H55_09235 [Betaproteobacteria bacterium]|nr:MAG: hypothetical protein E6H55_09235 [Betaproteobacteria bacterium]